MHDLTGTVELQVRFAATDTYTAGASTTFNFTATPVVVTPVITPSKTSAANREADVTFAVGAIDGVTFYYTLDGSTPTSSSTKYTEAVTLTGVKISSSPTAGLIDENTLVTVIVALAAGQTVALFTVYGVHKTSELSGEYS